MTAIEQLRKAVSQYPPVPGTMKHPDWEIIITEAVLELADKLDEVSAKD